MQRSPEQLKNSRKLNFLLFLADLLMIQVCFFIAIVCFHHFKVPSGSFSGTLKYFIGMPNGWKAVVGGSAGAAPAIAEVLAENLNYDEAIDIADRVINYYKNCGTKKRLGRYIKEIGFEEIKREIL